MSQLLRQTTRSTRKVLKPTRDKAYDSPVSKLRDTTQYLSGTTPRLRGNSTTAMRKMSKFADTHSQTASKADLEPDSNPSTTDLVSKHGDAHNISLSAILTELSVIPQPKRDQPTFLSKLDNKMGSVSTQEQVDSSKEMKEDVSTSGVSRNSSRSNSTFDWDVYLGDNAFSTRLVNNVIPHLFKKQVAKVFSLMDHIQCYSDLENNFNILTPEDVVSLFSSKKEVSTNLGHRPSGA